MARKTQKKQNHQLKDDDFVVVTYAEDPEQAKDYETLLKASDIPVKLKTQKTIEQRPAESFAIMVPEEYTDEAHVIIESQQAFDDFFDLAADYHDDNFDNDSCNSGIDLH